MKIIDSFMKSMTPVQNTGSLLKNPELSEKKTQDLPDSATETSRIISDLKNQGYEISSEEADRISEFIEKTDGPESEKLQTIKAALDKGLPLTTRSLQSIQTALFQPALPKELQKLLADSGTEVSNERVELLRVFARMAVEEESAIPIVTKQADVLLSSKAAAGVTVETDKDIILPVSEDRIMTWLLKALDQVAVLSESLGTEDADPTKAEPREKERPRNEIARDIEREPVSRLVSPGVEGAEDVDSEMSEIAPTVESSVKEAIELLISGLKEKETDPVQPDSYTALPEALMQGISLLIKEITPRMTAVKNEFETLRKTVTADLQAVRMELEKPMLSNKAKVVEQLTQAIEKLDKAILKSDIPLYTSMKAEKQLLKWSSELQEARSLVSDGQNTKAAEIVDRISKGIEEIQFQPAKLKVIHRTLQQAGYTNEFTEKNLQQRAQQQINRILEPIQTPRDVLEAFKALGLTHESEIVSALGQSSKKLKEDWLPQENLKEILMKLASDTQEKLTTVAGAEKALNNLTGQQLLSRPEAKPQGQTLFFSLPMEMANRVVDLKIYVQSRKDQGKVDWENCTFYFAVHTEKFGDVGIRFAAARKSVSIQVKCDNQALRDAVGPLVEDFKQTMWETGYKIAGISYSPLKENKAIIPKEEVLIDSETEGKGLNLKV